MPTLLITGASRGLGLEFVRQYAAAGWNVIATCRKPAEADKLQGLAKENKKIRIQELDVADANSIQSLTEKLKGMAIDLLINNAGVYSGGSPALSASDGDEGQSFGTLDPVAWNRVLHINTIAPLMITQAFAPNLRQGNESKIIFITSKMGSIEDTTRSGDIAYRTSKAALNAAMKNVALALLDKKIVVASLHPGWVKTDMGGNRALLSPETSITGMRHVIANLTLKDSGQFITYDGNILPW